MSELREIPRPKQVRFAQVVAKCGKPETYTLWAPPAKDKTFKAAWNANRVMTVHQSHVGTKKDYAVPSYDEGGELYLIFPKSLRKYEGKIVIGIKYNLLDQGPIESARSIDKKTDSSNRTASKKASASELKKAKAKSIAEAFKISASAEDPEPETEPKPKPKPRHQPKPKPQPKAKPKPSPRNSSVKKETPKPDNDNSIPLLKAIKHAMRALESGKHVKAYEVLKQAANA